jgi:hypothetical protein
MARDGSTMVESLTTKPMVEGSNPANQEEMAGKTSIEVKIIERAI